jgi:hypothetical protein
MRNLIKIISEDGGDFALFFEKEDLFFKLKGFEDPQGEKMEFIEIGKNIILNNQILKVIDINIKFENIKLNRTITGYDYNKSEFEDFSIETIITVKYIKNIS